MKALHLLKTSKGAAWAFLQIQALKKCGVDVEVILPDDGPMAKAYAESGTRTHLLEADISRLRSPMRFRHSARRLAEIVRESRPDIVHSHFVGTTLFARLALRRRSEIPRIFQVPGPLHLEQAITRRADLYTANKSDFWVASCIKTREIYEQSGVPKDHVFLSYYGIDFDRFKPDRPSPLRDTLGVRASTKLVGMVAFFYRPKLWLGHRRGIKGHEDLIDAVRILLDRNHDVACVVAGGAWESGDDYRKRVEDYGRERLGSRVHFLGYRDDVRGVYTGLDIAVQPSLSENLGGAAEALAMGVPSVATRVGGLPDAIVDGVTGWLAEPRDPQSLAAQVEDALLHPDEAQRRADRGYLHIRRLLDVTTNVDVLVDVYRRALASVRR